MQESFRYTLLLLLEEAFTNNKLFLIQYISNLYKYCPTLFTDLLQLNINLHEDEFEVSDTEDKDITDEYSSNLWIQQSTEKMVPVLDIPNVQLSVLLNLHSFLQKLQNVDLEGSNYTIIELPTIKKLSLYVIPISEVLDASSNLVFSSQDSRTFLLYIWDVSFL
ncbi:uncharacterized protein CIMG_13429 [Coccidioides immitis RS]|uniref:Uncharacterized protein n=1 Tax=Coccidioides immitis (strain RS) TaxID=246410 RepID=J3KEZ6_COCIM|nr:uncharacterized protein CIMG_13429 [Coccidioides immitis RS]EAS34135.3 hypothetical protein CIMG_13429 [Coccidioides immitis RS]